jgi:outer membrane receptor protein involved in Fe transport
MSFRSSVGGSERLFGRRLGYLLSGTYSYSQDTKEDYSRAFARQSGSSLAEFNRFNGSIAGESVLWGGLLNLSTLLSPNSRIGLNAIYNRTSDNEASRENTDLLEDSGTPVEVQRLDYVERSMWSSQLTGEHDMARHGFDWSVSGSGINRWQPDRSEIQYEVVPTTVAASGRLWRPTGEGAVRTFADLAENAVEGRLTYRRELGRTERTTTLKVGGSLRGTFRDSKDQSYEIWAPTIEDSVRALDTDVLFGNRYTAPDSSLFALRFLSQGGSYTAEDGIYAGFAMVETPLTQTLRLVTGARVEHSDTRIKAVSTLGSERTFTKKTFTDVLPSATLNYRPSVDHAIRLSVSRTLARPEYRELVPLRTQQGSTRKSQLGDTTLVRSQIDNADFRWEWYPAPGELLSAGVFAKRFHDPIEKVLVPTNTGPVIQARNAEGANNYGVELELRKGLGMFADALSSFMVFGSATFIHSEIKLGAAATSMNADRAMVGQAPYVYNAGLTYSTNDGRGSATLLYNRVGTRLFEAGEVALLDVEEVARDVVDFSARWPAMRGVQLRLDAKNLLDADYVLRQGPLVNERYSVGRTLQIGFSVQR